MSRVQQYWLPGYGLSRHIVLGHIQYFLGPSATVRPFAYQACLAIAFHYELYIAHSNQIPLQGREGYLINGVPLTREQIDDLAIMSREYEKQEATRMAHNTSGGSTSSSSSDHSSIQSEPYINEIIPINQSGSRRQLDSRGGR
ncbi:uncharacterized protein N7479_009217 [Penicillium vulpinum]|uniref:Uncharacterized protein n=1 Tax=Penicillium vulpinum TaxID=29845 RepID=A0A1V6RWR8_9EURO|nr:uncharacterized protein N7479_009217 [Penicillium vulpinum]KAJ5950804.1 hypothetical protein N7479_009217 [Penicillium vulpinum]OQE05934.1 hypothetical protein PENVUL_c021G03497 [Penicillium vulpinum]